MAVLRKVATRSDFRSRPASPERGRIRLAAGCRARVTHAVVAISIAVGLIACSTFEHGYQIEKIASRSLSTATETGRLRLALESEYDSAVRELVARMGEPEWLHVVDRNTVYLYYTRSDQVAVIKRPMVPPGEVRVYPQTPGFLLQLLPKSSADRLLAARDARHQAKRAKQTRRDERARPETRRSVPASRARTLDNVAGFTAFDPDLIIDRLRIPLSAADPGVSDWNSGKLPDGAKVWLATNGTTRYLLRTDSISATAIIAPRGRSTPLQARHAFHRINQAVFGTRGDAVNRRIEPLVSQVAADTSGRTHVNHAVDGRSVSVSRDAGHGTLVYTVHSR